MKLKMVKRKKEKYRAALIFSNFWCHDTRHNGPQHNDIRLEGTWHSDTYLKNTKHCDILHNDILRNVTQRNGTLCKW